MTRARRGRDEEETFRSIADFLGAFMWQADAATLAITFMTKGVRDLTGLDASAWLGDLDAWTELIDSEDRDGVAECLRAVASDGHDRQVECRVQAADGHTVWLRHAVSRIEGGAGESELWAVATDITSDKVAEDEARLGRERYKQLIARAADFEKQALEDGLTGLPNRVLFDDRLQAVLRQSERTGAPLSVLMMDLDHFKEINDTKGHQAGDVVLKHVALRLRIAMRAQDTPARFGGDEFAALLPNTDTEGAVRAAQRIVHAFDDPIESEGEALPVGVSVGLAVYPDNGEDAETLLAHADAAMYQAKANGGGYALGWTADDAARRAGSRAKRRRERRRTALSRRAMQMMTGVAAVLALIAGAMVPVARNAGETDSQSRLDAAAVELAHLPEDQIETVVASVEDALVNISWKDVSATDVTATLDRLQSLLTGLSSYVSTALSTRVERLIATIEQARTVANIASSGPGRDRGRQPTNAPPYAGSSPVVPDPLASSSANVEIPTGSTAKYDLG